MASQTITEQPLFPLLDGRDTGPIAISLRAERRQRARLRIAKTVKVTIGRNRTGMVADMMEDGVGIRALGRKLRPGSTLSLRFDVEGITAPVSARGIVVWASASGDAGIRFLNRSRSGVRTLYQWIIQKQVSNAAAKLLGVAGDFRAALQLVPNLVRTLTSANQVEIMLLPRGSAVGMSVARKGEPEAIHFTAGDALEKFPARSTISAPLYHQQEIIGHLEMKAAELGAFDEQDAGALRGLADVIGEMVQVQTLPVINAAEPTSRTGSKLFERIEDLLRRSRGFRLPAMPRIKLHLR